MFELFCNFIRSSKAVVGRFIIIFLLSTVAVFVCNAFLIEDFLTAFGKASHTVLGILVLSLFLQIFKKKKVDLWLVAVLWAVFNIPLFVTLQIQPELLSNRAICENNVWAITQAVFLLSATYLTALISRRWLRYMSLLGVAFCWVVSFVPVISFIVFLIGFGEFLSNDIVIAVAQTNPKEVFEYMLFKGMPVICGVVISVLAMIALCVLVFRKNIVWAWPKSRSFRFLFFILCCFSLFSSFKSVDNITLSPFYGAYIDVREMDRFKEGVERRKKILNDLAQKGEKGRKGLFVIVIGESHTRDRMSAYNFLDRDTTPWQKSMRDDKDFIFLEKGYTSYVSTVQALAYALTTKTQYTSQNFEDSPSIVELVKASGYNTYWLSNQSKLSPWDTPTAIISSCADHHIWLGEGLDENLLEVIPTQTEESTIVFVHLMGSHTNYINRYSSSFKIWDESDKNNTYDNSLRYNDWILSRIYEKVKWHSNFQAMIYMADHGENPMIGHLPANFTWDMARIPIWFALSKSFVSAYPDTVAALRSNSKMPFTNDMMFDTLCGILGLKKWSFYEPKNDISSSTYDRSVEELRTLYGEKRIDEDPNL